MGSRRGSQSELPEPRLVAAVASVTGLAAITATTSAVATSHRRVGWVITLRP
jgi:hypothetical protein